ncbi:unnamed protein product [Pedinophyceae sp. YPF-701]|nr:unnamed protein product [Pedinophyceae sp. YPF-701]
MEDRLQRLEAQAPNEQPEDLNMSGSRFYKRTALPSGRSKSKGMMSMFSSGLGKGTGIGLAGTVPPASTMKAAAGASGHKKPRLAPLGSSLTGKAPPPVVTAAVELDAAAQRGDRGSSHHPSISAHSRLDPISTDGLPASKHGLVPSPGAFMRGPPVAPQPNLATASLHKKATLELPPVDQARRPQGIMGTPKPGERKERPASRGARGALAPGRATHAGHTRSLDDAQVAKRGYESVLEGPAEPQESQYTSNRSGTEFHTSLPVAPDGAIDEEELIRLHEMHAGAGAPLQPAKSGLSRRQSKRGEELGDPEAARCVDAEDVVSYYLRHGKQAGCKLFYLNPSSFPADPRWDPYAMECVVQREAAPEHYTISASGVVHVVPGGEATFQDLGSFIRESKTFNLISSIPFFRNYLVAKFFRFWRLQVRNVIFKRMRSKIASRLFIAKPAFLRPIALAAKTRTVIADANLLAGAPDGGELTHRLWRVPEFLDENDAHRRMVLESFKDEVEELGSTLLKTCQEVSEEETHAREQVEIDTHSLRGPAAARVSISLQKQQKQERLKTYHRLREEVELLPSLVRMVDYMIAAAGVECAANNAAGLVTMLESFEWKPPSIYKGTFDTIVGFTERGVTFSPDRYECAEAMAEISDGFVQVAGLIPRPLFMKYLSPFFPESYQRRSIDAPDILGQAVAFQEDSATAVALVNQSFDEAAEYVSFLDSKMDMYRFVTQHRDKSRLLQTYTEPQDLVEIMVKLKQWLRGTEQIRNCQVQGVLSVDLRQVKAFLFDHATEIYATARDGLLELARSRTATAIKEVQGAIKDLGRRPERLEDFVAFCTAVEGYDSVIPKLLEQVQRTDHVYEMLAATDFKPDIKKDSLPLETLHEARGELEESLEAANDFIDKNRTRIVQLVERGLSEVDTELLDVVTELNRGRYADPDADPEALLETLEDLDVTLSALAEKTATLNGYQRVLGLHVSANTNLEQALRDLAMRNRTWVGMYKLRAMMTQWSHVEIPELDMESMSVVLEELIHESYKLSKMHRDDPVALRLAEEVDRFKVFQPLLEMVASPALQDRHWKEIFEILGQEQTGAGAAGFTFADLVAAGLQDKQEECESIVSLATKEYSVRLILDRMIEELGALELHCTPYKDSPDLHVIGQVDDIQLVLEEQVMKVQSIIASPFSAAFKEEAHKWEQLVLRLELLLEEWVKCQQQWMYLEPIFTSDDIAAQMPEDLQKFLQVHQTQQEIMANVVDDPALTSVGEHPEYLDTFQHNNVLLEDVNKALAAYLDSKRLAFPRFFFLSNDEMLEILSETRDPTRVQPHLKKCFEGIQTLDFEGRNRDKVVTAMNSAAGERVPFRSRVYTKDAKGRVERWLLGVEHAMIDAVIEEHGAAVEAYRSKARSDWVVSHPGMCVLSVSGVFWTRGAETAILEGSLPGYYTECHKQLMELVHKVRGDLTALERITIGALVVHDVHARDVVQLLQRERVAALSEFTWQAQLRSYWEEVAEGNTTAVGHRAGRQQVETGPIKVSALSRGTKLDDNEQKQTINLVAGSGGGRGKSARRVDDGEGPEMTMVLRMMAAQVDYGYEYLGNQNRLVVTPLTDRCYRTLVGAYQLHLGGSPEGPAGTGKTETTKDLAKVVARHCLVFNCSDSLDVHAMGKFLKGLAATGAWACFDEFNRIDIEVLSVAAQQIMAIQMAVAAKLFSFEFEGIDIILQPSVWVAVTMNPSYAGRNELPENLKARFRTVAMMVPDYSLIAEIMLFSEGYTRSRECATKLVQCYKLCSEQLSSQFHYDYGMRAVIAVLRAAASLKRKHPTVDEYRLMLRALIDVNLCKFVAVDIPLFQGIVADLFPDTRPITASYGLLKTALVRACQSLDYQPSEGFLFKIIQLYELLLVRHGLMLVGQPLTGKSAAYKVLAEAMTILATEHGEQWADQPVTTHVMNPKAMDMGQLFGRFDPVSREWQDGVLAMCFRNAARSETPERHWVVMDGPVDALWIENMNTVLDDNQKLCLNSGEVIKMSRQMTMVFEVEDLSHASPATVSRCGMVYCAPTGLGWRPLVLSWVQQLGDQIHMPQTYQVMLLGLVNNYVPTVMRFVLREVQPAVPCSEASLVQTFIRQYTSMCQHMGQPGWFHKRADLAPSMVQNIFVMACIWSFGALCHTDNERNKFSRMLLSLFNDKYPKVVDPDGEYYRDGLETSNLSSWKDVLQPPQKKLDQEIGFDPSGPLGSQDRASLARTSSAIMNSLSVDNVASDHHAREPGLYRDAAGSRSLKQQNSLQRTAIDEGDEGAESDEDDSPLSHLASLAASQNPSRANSRRASIKDPTASIGRGGLITQASLPAVNKLSGVAGKFAEAGKKIRNMNKFSTRVISHAQRLSHAQQKHGSQMADVEVMMAVEVIKEGGLEGQDSSAVDSAYQQFLSMLDQVTALGCKLDAEIMDATASTVFDWWFDPTINNWKQWKFSMDPPPESTGGRTFREIIIPTVEQAQVAYLMGLSVEGQSPLLLSGPTGVGKSIYIKQFIKTLPAESFVPAVHIMFSARTTAASTQAAIAAKLDRRRRGVFGPPIGKRAVVFVDDLSMPRPEEFGAQPPIELLRNVLDHKGWYGQDHSFWSIADCVIVGAMVPPGGARHRMTGRFLRHFNLVLMPEHQHGTMMSIFGTLLNLHISNAMAPVRAMARTTINATLSVFRAAQRFLMPTPAKSHYMFNSRDVARVIEGLTLASVNELVDTAWCRLWCHEVMRVFGDRLVAEEDVAWLKDTVVEAISRDFAMKLNIVFPEAPPRNVIEAQLLASEEEFSEVKLQREIRRSEHAALEKCTYVGFVELAEAEAGQGVGTERRKKYAEPSGGWAEVYDAVRQALEDYNSTHARAKLDLSIFHYATAHLVRITRSLQLHGENMMLIGVGGNGRRSLARIAAFICHMHFIEPEGGREYGITDWFDDLKEACVLAGAVGKPVVLFVPESKIREEVYIEHIASLMHSGEVPNVFSTEERSTVLERMRESLQEAAARAAGTAVGTSGFTELVEMETYSTSELWSKFVSRVKRYLHVVLSLNTIEASFRERLRQFPSLVNCSNIDWYGDWPVEALRSVAKHRLETRLPAEFRTAKVPVRELIERLNSLYIARGSPKRAATPTAKVPPSTPPEGAAKDAAGDAGAEPAAEAELEASSDAEGDEVAEAPAPAELDADAGGVGEEEGRVSPPRTKKVDVSAAVVEVVTQMHTYMHEKASALRYETGRWTYVMPRHFINLLDAFGALLLKRKEELSTQRQRYTSGLQHLEDAKGAVISMHGELSKLKPKLERATQEVAAIMEKLEEDRKKVEENHAMVDKEVDRANDMARAAEDIRAECEERLAEAMPAMEAAIAALNTIKPADMRVVQTFKNPPMPIKLVLEAVLVLLDVPPIVVPDPTEYGKKIVDYWTPSLRMLQDVHLIDKLKNYDKDNIRKDIMQRITRDYVALEDFNPDRCARASSAVEGICKWVIALEVYDRIAKEVAPRRAALKEAEAVYQSKMEVVNEKQAELQVLLDEMNRLEARAKEMQMKRDTLEQDIADAERKLDRAERLITGLASEQERWKREADLIGDRRSCIVGDMLLAASTLTYLGPYALQTRRDTTLRWREVMLNENLTQSSVRASLSSILGDPVRVLEWHLAGLPRDPLSVDNALLVTNAHRWPLLIDPVRQAANWIRKMERPHNLQVVRHGSRDMMIKMENAAQFGLPVMVQHVGESLDPALTPILNVARLSPDNAVQLLRIGGATIELNAGFRLYLVTELKNPHFPPRVHAETTVINFAITEQALADQMTTVVLREELPQLETQRNQLVIQSAEHRRQLRDIEDNILRVVGDAEGSILEDEAAITAVQESKSLAEKILEQQAETEATQEQLEDAAQVYTGVGNFAAMLFFCIQELSTLDPMYEYSLDWFSALFVSSITEARAGVAEGATTDERLGAIKSTFLLSLYQKTCISLFARDTLMLAFLMSRRILESRKELTKKQMQFLLVGSEGMASAYRQALTDHPLSRARPKDEGAEWVTPAVWSTVLRLSLISPGLKDLPQAIIDHPGEWDEALHQSPKFDRKVLPGVFGMKLKAADVVLLARGLCKDKLLQTVRQLVLETLGPDFVETPPVDLRQLYADSAPDIPMVFILAPGLDAASEVYELANRVGMRSRVVTVSLGQGQGEKAEAAIRSAQADGGWVLLANCHLATSWMPRMEQIVQGIDTESCNSQFRLIMTSMPSRGFPLSVLRRSIKICNEPPQGMKANLQRCLSLDPIVDEAWYQECAHPRAVMKLVHVLGVLHAVVQERSQYGPLGWNQPYKFSDSDLRISADQARQFAGDAATVPWVTLRYMVGELNYGGRVTDENDRRLLSTLVASIMQQDIVDKPGTPYLWSESPITLPAADKPEEYRAAVEALRVDISPEAIGLHSNAEMARDLLQADAMIASLVDITVGAATTVSLAQHQELEQQVYVQIKDILASLPRPFDIEKLRAQFPVDYKESMNQTLVQEAERYNALLAVVESSLTSLRLAIEGVQIMSEGLEEMLQHMSLGKVPSQWLRSSYPSQQPLGSYVKDLLQRLEMLRTWTTQGQPKIFWLPGFFFTHAFLTALLQNYARRLAIPIDEVAFDFQCLMLFSDPAARQITSPQDGAYIHGLFLEGAAWSVDMHLTEQRPKKLLCDAPIIWFRPCRPEDRRKYQHYDCPVYRTQERRGSLATTGHSTNFLLSVRLPTTVDPHHWVLRGACMICTPST